ncbi:DUF4124 domain-containing protein [Azomonas macrocytogenes]|uniref:DUF4124 domain-containing protein n=1 Tax=Azomonas macrocytogenes TaxID=69962 RepID=A0A839T9Z5_AZOMA|nr:DUF4124 domain-containing protein [Azomonas macrocytogenes]MBB3104984.1 hypothetical protein [Azomonas macrocytogenes]
MRMTVPVIASVLLLGIPEIPYAASIYRCIDSNGNTTFTQQGCPADQNTQWQENHNQPNSPAIKSISSPPKQKDVKKHNDDTLTIVGQQDDGCGNLLENRDKRKAILQKQIRAGISRADVESALGKPDTITFNDGKRVYRYKANRHQSRTVSFDENDCVIGKVSSKKKR